MGFDFTNLDDIMDKWCKYDGYFKDDIKEGKGTLYFCNGEKFIGEFAGDCANGEG